MSYGKLALFRGSRQKVQMERQAKSFAYPSLPWADKCPCPGALAFDPHFCRLLFSLPAHLSCCCFPSPEAAVAETRTRGRKSGLTTCWWTDEAPGLAGIPKTWRAKGGEKDFCPPGVQLPSLWSVGNSSSSGVALLQEQSLPGLQGKPKSLSSCQESSSGALKSPA